MGRATPADSRELLNTDNAARNHSLPSDIYGKGSINIHLKIVIRFTATRIVQFSSNLLQQVKLNSLLIALHERLAGFRGAIRHHSKSSLELPYHGDRNGNVSSGGKLT